MQGIQISSDICVYSHESFHGPLVQLCVGAGSSQRSGAGAQVGGCKAFVLGQLDEVCKLFLPPLYFRPTNFEKNVTIQLFSSKAVFIYYFFPAKQCK